MNRWFAVVGGVSMNLALGSLYAWSVFVAPLEAEFGWTRTQTSWVFTIAIVTFALSFVLAGRIQDRRGPRICAVIGATLVGLGFILASFTSSLPFLYVAFGFVVGAGNGFGYATPIPVGSKWFPDKRGLVVGLMVAGYGGGSAIFGPVATALISEYGWRPTFRIMGVVLFSMCMLGTLLLKNPPSGYRPAGWSPRGGADRANVARHSDPGDVAHADLLLPVGGFLSGHHGRADDDQPARAVCPKCRDGGRRRGLRDYDRGARKHEWADRLRMVVGCRGSAHDAQDHDPDLRRRDAGPVRVAGAGDPVLHLRGGHLLVFRHASCRCSPRLQPTSSAPGTWV